MKIALTIIINIFSESKTLETELKSNYRFQLITENSLVTNECDISHRKAWNNGFSNI